MSSAHQSLSFHQPSDMPDISSIRFALVTAEWNADITDRLYESAYSFLVQAGASPANLTSVKVPGSFELTSGAALLLRRGGYDAVICLGCVIQGETRHFDFICDAVANGLTKLSIHYTIPVIFGVLTTENQQQAMDRAGGKYGNKGAEAASTAIKMAVLADAIQKL